MNLTQTEHSNRVACPEHRSVRSRPGACALFGALASRRCGARGRGWAQALAQRIVKPDGVAKQKNFKVLTVSAPLAVAAT